MSGYKFRNFETGNELATELAKVICEQLGLAIEKRGYATLAVSGGSTPKRLFAQLSKTKIPWHKVTVLLVDERWVDENNVRSNARLVAENLLTNEAAAAKFFGLYSSGSPIEDAITEIDRQIGGLNLPIDVVILGMGSDGHTASFFPNGIGLGEAVDPKTKNLVAQVEAENAVEPRITLTLPVIINARYLGLHIEGKDKRAVFDEAAKNGPADELPIRHVLRNSQSINVFWAP